MAAPSEWERLVSGPFSSSGRGEKEAAFELYRILPLALFLITPCHRVLGCTEVAKPTVPEVVRINNYNRLFT